MFGAVSLTKNADIDQYKYSGYGIGFDSRACARAIGGAEGSLHHTPTPTPKNFLPCKKNKSDIFFRYIALFQVLTVLLFYDAV